MDNFLKSKAKDTISSTWMQKHVAIVGAVAIVVPLIFGAILLNSSSFGDRRTKLKSRPRHRILNATSPTEPEPPVPAPVVKLIVSDGSQETNIDILNRCSSEEVTIVQNNVVQCTDNQSPEVRAWINSTRLHEDRLIHKFLEFHVKRCSKKKRNVKTIKSIEKKTGATVIQKQGLLWFNNTNNTKKEQVDTAPSRRPFKDRNAELFYFLALVLGVLGKYFWDHYEDKRVGKPTQFEPHLIVMSFIIAALVYYSIQQGLEKEANKFAIRGLVFAFNNGFMWQTVLTSMNRTRNTPTPPSKEGQPAE